MLQNNFRKVQKLKKKIDVSRRKLQELWDAKGHTDADVLEASIELDVLINLYQKQKVKAEHISIRNSLTEKHHN